MSLPGADELFRTTGGTALQSSSPRRPANGTPANGEAPRVPAPGGEADPTAPQQGGAAQRRPEGEPAAAASGASVPAEQHSGRDTADEAAKERRRQEAAAAGAPAAGSPARRRGGRGANRRPSGRERHDEKITVYVSAEELMDLEHARLVLRGEHGLAVDRGRIVREAVAVVLADLESRGDASILVRRLRGR
ncbi:hypothetical protein GCM10010361_44060 [Streptomyces olivaceiscleroticus]|uniref:Cobyrinic acid a,c-diamide synthase n=1 Tax=Streptomyces olivaceiscleroticus TaxID=68245 RepID=A0ABN1AEZ3_9ACTN|nr:hypothetical protein [Streptomyces niger]